MARKETRTGRLKKAAIEPNPSVGERGDFLKIMVTMPPEMLEELKILGVRRRAAGNRDSSVSALVREVVVELLIKEGGR